MLYKEYEFDYDIILNILQPMAVLITSSYNREGKISPIISDYLDLWLNLYAIFTQHFHFPVDGDIAFLIWPGRSMST